MQFNEHFTGYLFLKEALGLDNEEMRAFCKLAHIYEDLNAFFLIPDGASLNLDRLDAAADLTHQLLAGIYFLICERLRIDPGEPTIHVVTPLSFRFGEGCNPRAVEAFYELYNSVAVSRKSCGRILEEVALNG